MANAYSGSAVKRFTDAAIMVCGTPTRAGVRRFKRWALAFFFVHKSFSLSLKVFSKNITKLNTLHFRVLLA